MSGEVRPEERLASTPKYLPSTSYVTNPQIKQILRKNTDFAPYA